MTRIDSWPDAPEARDALQRELVAAMRDAEGLVVFPTESYYALGARADAPGAVERLVALKGREPGKPIPLAAATRQAVERVATIDGRLAALADAFWPGPLTLALHPKIAFAPELCAADGTVGIRVSADSVVQLVAEACGGLVTATSANYARQPPAADVRELAPTLVEGVDRVIDGGALPGGRPSTVVGLRGGQVIVFRPGAIDAAALARVVGEVVPLGSGT